MSLQQQLELKLTQALTPHYLEVLNESHQHSGPAGDSHFKVIAVSEQFQSLSRVDRHRYINQLLAEWMGQPIHALSLQLFTPAEWQARGAVALPSPPCRGGSKRLQ